MTWMKRRVGRNDGALAADLRIEGISWATIRMQMGRRDMRVMKETPLRDAGAWVWEIWGLIP
jgi:hypothetical protein